MSDRLPATGTRSGPPRHGQVVGQRDRAPARVIASPDHRVRADRRRVPVVAGTLRACRVPGPVFVHPGATGLLLVIAAESALITCTGVFNPVFALTGSRRPGA